MRQEMRSVAACYSHPLIEARPRPALVQLPSVADDELDGELLTTIEEDGETRIFATAAAMNAPPSSQSPRALSVLPRLRDADEDEDEDESTCLDARLLASPPPLPASQPSLRPSAPRHSDLVSRARLAAAAIRLRQDAARLREQLHGRPSQLINLTPPYRVAPIPAPAVAPPRRGFFTLVRAFALFVGSMGAAAAQWFARRSGTEWHRALGAASSAPRT